MSSQLPPRTRANIEITIFGFLVSLTLKAGLDSAYSQSLSNLADWRDLIKALCSPFSVQVLAFLLTIIRFVFGAYRFHEETQEPPEGLEPWLRLWNIAGTLMLFVLFYIAGLCVRNPQTFYVSLAIAHGWDLVWFIVAVLFSRRLSKELKSVMTAFVVFDFITVVLLFAALDFCPNHITTLGIVIMSLLGISDFWWNRNFFFHPDRWHAQNAQA